MTLTGRFTSRILADSQAFKEAEVLKSFLRTVVGLFLFGWCWWFCVVWGFLFVCLFVFKWKKTAGKISW